MSKEEPSFPTMPQGWQEKTPTRDFLLILIISDPNLKQESSVTLVVPSKKNMGHIQAGDYSYEITLKNMRKYKLQKRLLQRAKKHSRESQKT